MKMLYEIKVNEKIIKNILNAIEDKGSTIQNLIDKTKYARGTIKTYLMVLCFNKKIEEICYNQNTKVYFKLKCQQKKK